MSLRINIDPISIEFNGDKSVAHTWLEPYSFDYESNRNEPSKIISSVSVYNFELLIIGYTGRCL